MSRLPEVHILPNETAAAAEVAAFLSRTITTTLQTQPLFRLVLSGGSTPRTLYRTLAATPWASHIPWPRMQFWFGDERAVPPDHAESNYAAAASALFGPLGIPDGQIFRMHGEWEPEEASRDYESRVRKTLLNEPPTIPTFDTILLGLGEDGHTASLFPNSPALAEQTRLIVPSVSPVGTAKRMTMTYPVLNHARIVLFLVTGAKKAAIVKRILEQAGGDPPLPAARIRPTNGQLLWYLDDAAAAHLTSDRPGRSGHEEETQL